MASGSRRTGRCGSPPRPRTATGSGRGRRRDPIRVRAATRVPPTFSPDAARSQDIMSLFTPSVPSPGGARLRRAYHPRACSTPDFGCPVTRDRPRGTTERLLDLTVDRFVTHRLPGSKPTRITKRRGDDTTAPFGGWYLARRRSAYPRNHPTAPRPRQRKTPGWQWHRPSKRPASLPPAAPPARPKATPRRTPPASGGAGSRRRTERPHG
jgi:hypothetical protein